MTKTALTAKVTKDLQYTSGVGFTCDHWTSKNMDPYFGMTLHYIDRHWQMNRYKSLAIAIESSVLICLGKLMEAWYSNTLNSLAFVTFIFCDENEL